MNSSQRLIKTIADAVAVTLIVCIFLGVCIAFLGVVSRIDAVQKEKNSSGEIVLNESSSTPISMQINDIEFDVSSVYLYVKTADYFSWQANDDSFLLSENNGKLTVTDKGNNKSDAVVILTVPKTVTFKSFDFDCESGMLSVENLNCQNFSAELGLGDTYITDINVTGMMEVDIGVGKFEVKSGSISNLKISGGVGTAEINAKLTGISDIKAGVGELVVNSNIPISYYTVNIKKGIGKILVADKNVSVSETIGTGVNVIQIEGGVGSVNVSFAD